MSRKPTSKTRRSSPASQTDWERVDAMRDEVIDFSDIPEVAPEDFARAFARKGFKAVPGKRQVTLRIDEDVLEWFKAQGSGYQTRINELLRAYKEAHERE